MHCKRDFHKWTSSDNNNNNNDSDNNNNNNENNNDNDNDMSDARYIYSDLMSQKLEEYHNQLKRQRSLSQSLSQSQSLSSSHYHNARRHYRTTPNPYAVGARTGLLYGYGYGATLCPTIPFYMY